MGEERERRSVGGRSRENEIETEKEIESRQKMREGGTVTKKGIKGQRVSLNVINVTVSGWQQG